MIVNLTDVRDFAELLLVRGVGARTVRVLAQVAEVTHGAPFRFSDPARLSVPHGSKDRHPFPVPLKVYDRTIAAMKSAVVKAKLDEAEELAPIRRLDERAHRLERFAGEPSVQALFAEERARSGDLGGLERPRTGARFRRLCKIVKARRVTNDSCGTRTPLAAGVRIGLGIFGAFKNLAREIPCLGCRDDFHDGQRRQDMNGAQVAVADARWHATVPAAVPERSTTSNVWVAVLRRAG